MFSHAKESVYFETYLQFCLSTPHFWIARTTYFTAGFYEIPPLDCANGALSYFISLLYGWPYFVERALIFENPEKHILYRGLVGPHKSFILLF